MKDSGKGRPFSSATSGMRSGGSSISRANSRRLRQARPSVDWLEPRALLSAQPFDVGGLRPNFAAADSAQIYGTGQDAAKNPGGHREGRAEVHALGSRGFAVHDADATLPAQSGDTTTQIVPTIIVLNRRIRVNLAVTVAAVDSSLGVPTGSVQVRFGSHTVTAPLDHGSARFISPPNLIARKKISADYSGDSLFAPSESPAMVINPALLPHVLISPRTA